MAPVTRRQAPDRRRAIPSIERLVRTPPGAALLGRWRREHVLETMRTVLHEVRANGEDVPDADELVRRTGVRLERAAVPRLTPVVNATGVVLHTNLGRALLADDAVAAVVAAARHPVNLELDLLTGRRGERDELVADDLRALTGAEAALVVNNNAAAVLLALNSLAADRDVVVSRGELVEIGGAFRIPDVLAKSGARLCEVGTTNRTRADDYRQGVVQQSYDKQFVRNWLTSAESGWDRYGDQPPPALPQQIVDATRSRYIEAYERISGLRFADWIGPAA